MHEVQQKAYQHFLIELVLVKNYNFKVIDKYEKEDDCIVCLESMKGVTAMTPPCNHTICHSCMMDSITEWEWHECMDCFTQFTFVENNNDEDEADDNVVDTKVEDLKIDTNIGGAIVSELSKINDMNPFDIPSAPILDNEDFKSVSSSCDDPVDVDAFDFLM